jgi:glycosyltransferase involved in cell wall biosynthesis
MNSPTGILDPNIPASATPIRIRQNHKNKNLFFIGVHAMMQTTVNYINKKRWNIINNADIRQIDLSSKILISLSRPKIMSDYVKSTNITRSNMNFVPLLHDMIPLHNFSHRGNFNFSSNFLFDNQTVIEAATLVLANSKFTAGEIVNFSEKSILPKTPKVIPVPLCHEFRVTNENVIKKGPSSRYILCVGIYNGRKNLECVTESMLLLKSRGIDLPDLVLAGARRKRVDKFLQNKRYSDIFHKFIFVENPNQAELALLYQNAFVLALPSRMEGWGLPISEALWFGTPAVAADVPALREAGGDLALYFDPESPAALADLLTGMLSEPESYRAIKKKITDSKDNLRTWKDVAKDILKSWRPHE